MKNIFKHISMFCFALLFLGCESNLDKVQYNPANATAAKLNSIDQTLPFSGQSDANELLVLEWENPNIGVNTPVTNVVEMDLESGDSSKKIVLASLQNEGRLEISYRDINKKVNELVQLYGVQAAPSYGICFNVVSSISENAASLVSNTVSTNVSTYVPEEIEATNLMFTNTATPPVQITSIDMKQLVNGATALDPTETVVVLNWTKSTFDMLDAQLYKVMINLPGRERKEVELASVEGVGMFEISAQLLNSKIKTLVNGYQPEQPFVAGETYMIDFYVQSQMIGDDTVLNSVTEELEVVTYKSSEPAVDAEAIIVENTLSVPGDYLGWNNGSGSQYVFSNDGNVYTGRIIFGEKAANGWKISQYNDWGTSWGTASESASATNPSTLTLDGSSNIKDYNKFSYDFEFNKTTKVLTVLNSVDDWSISVNGEDKDLVYQVGTYTDASQSHYLTATFALSNGDEWYIRADQKDDVVVKFSDVSLIAEPVADCVEGADGNFKMTKDATYTVKYYFNRKAPVVVIFENK